ncbi:hypothetical protein CAPTEDRAFT_227529 [Capitella teleta]|uniref:Syndecan n=1 Tax=Capitella teleta TaxID=283909 RepID=R7UJ97_CAPTE|nr:hypothetical protein CAPTEDRAFT_227529 [Capitella teleta]|eukprot:ELU06158.1 hypothetical protein CAPTEDRAFT_227529 [Capitella teleta]
MQLPLSIKLRVKHPTETRLHPRDAAGCWSECNSCSRHFPSTEEDSFREVIASWQVVARPQSAGPQQQQQQRVADIINIDDEEGDYWERIRALEWNAQKNILISDDEDSSLHHRHIRSIEGSGFDDGANGLDDGGSGWDTTNDDEDQDEGSGTPCQSLRLQLNGQKLIGAYIPRCTDHGDFMAKQCHASTGQCWCVNFDGQEIPGTMRYSPDVADCTGVDRSKSHMPAPTRPNKPRPGSNSRPDSPGDFEINDPYDSNGGIGFEPPNHDNDQNKKTVPVDIGVVEAPDDDHMGHESIGSEPSRNSIISQPGILASIIGGAVVGLLCTTLLMMFVVYRMRKKDEGSYALDDPKQKSRDREFFA